MSDDTNTPPGVSSTAAALGIEHDQRVRLIGDTTTGNTLLGALPPGVVLTSLESEPADIGIVIVEDDNDLRERLFTELEGLKSASAVWILSNLADGGPDADVIGGEAETVSWRAESRLDLGQSWVAVSLTFDD